MLRRYYDRLETQQNVCLHLAKTGDVAPLQIEQRSYRSFSFITCISMVIMSFSFLFFLSDEGWSKLGAVLRQTYVGTLYHVQRQWNTRSAFELFAARDAVFTQTLDAATLQKLLNDRRRLRGGFFENSLVAACSDNSAVLSTTLLSWNRVRKVRELIIVDYDSTLEGPMTSLQLVNSIDKLGRVLFVTAGSRRLSRESRGSKRIGRARALNLGVAMASGKNVAVVDCNTKVSPWLLSEHPISNGTFYTGSFHQAFGGENLEYNVMFMRKSAFMAASGFDERIDIPGVEFRDLMTRLTRQQRLRRLSMDKQMIQTLPRENEESIVLAKDSSLVDAGDIMERVRRTRELSGYIFTMASKQMPYWDGHHADGTDTMLSLRALRFTVLRRQVESARYESRTKSGALVSDSADYRLWLQALVQGKNAAFMLDVLPRRRLHYVLLNAHRKLLHNDYKLPWEVLRTMEGEFSESAKGGMGAMGEEEKERVVLGRIMNYMPLVFEVVWRKKKVVVVKMEVEEAIELFVGVSWAIGFAICKDRALILVGRIAETPINRVLDYDGIADVMHRDYNLKVKIMGGGEWDCRRKGKGGCWDGDAVGDLWDEYNLTGEPSELRDDSGRHEMLHMESGRIERWEGGGNGSRLQSRLQRLAFASICVSRRVGERVEKSVSLELTKRIEESLGIVLSGGEERMGEVVRRVREVAGKGERMVFVSGGKWERMREVVTSLGEQVEMMGGIRDGIGKVGELWVVMRCERIIFDGEEMVGAWKGAVKHLASWRRVHIDDDSGGAMVRASHSGMQVISFG